jgi:Fe/S biogenesis protein NfuA
MTAADQASLESILRISPTAREKMLEARAEDPQPERLVLWLEVTGVVDGEYTYDMYFQFRETVTASDTVLGDGDLTIAMPPDSVEKLRGASVDWVVEFDHTGWVITNPNRLKPTIGSPLPVMPVGPSSPAVGSRPPADLKADLSGAVAQRVMMVLDRQVNPSIAAHGGHAELVAVEDKTAYLRLSGGCQGCSMATVTLGQGIEVAIKELVPEITRVLDVTDHASGTSPYFEAAKA